MAEKQVDRRLAAILAADVVGYSRLMGADEEGTLAALTAHRTELIEPSIAENRGRIVKTTGDGLLAEFVSVVDAVRCAVSIQYGMRARNTGISLDRAILFRVGVNLGDVIAQDGDVYGDGVNIAARLEGLAPPGGVCISGTVYDHVHGKLEVGLTDLGAQEVKNISRPVRVYRLELDGEKGVSPSRTPASWRRASFAVAIALLVVGAGGLAWWRPWTSNQDPASVETIAPDLPDRPSVAVLPFANMSDDKDQEYFADGISEDIIVGLSKVSGIFVIARNSSFAYKGQSRNVKEIARDLGVRYVLSGSIRRAEEQLRITARLVDALHGNNLWADRYDRRVSDVFAVQSEISSQVVESLSVTLKASEQERLFRTHTTSLPAYDLFLQARRAHLIASKINLARAQDMYERVIELDPQFAGGYAGLSVVHSVRARLGYSNDRHADGKRALELAEKAISVDKEFGWGYIALGGALVVMGDADAAVAAVREALEIQPNDADAHLFMGWYLTYAGNAPRGIEHIRTSMRLDPKPNNRQYFFLGVSYLVNGDAQNAVDAMETWSTMSSLPIGLAFLAASYAEHGEIEKAEETTKRLLAKDPNFTIADWEFVRLFRRSDDRARILAAAHAAGIPNQAKTR